MGPSWSEDGIRQCEREGMLGREAGRVQPPLGHGLSRKGQWRGVLGNEPTSPVLSVSRAVNWVEVVWGSGSTGGGGTGYCSLLGILPASAQPWCCLHGALSIWAARALHTDAAMVSGLSPARACGPHVCSHSVTSVVPCCGGPRSRPGHDGTHHVYGPAGTTGALARPSGRKEGGTPAG